MVQIKCYIQWQVINQCQVQPNRLFVYKFSTEIMHPICALHSLLPSQTQVQYMYYRIIFIVCKDNITVS